MFFSVCHIGRTKKQILINELQKCKDEKRKYFPSWIFFYCLRFDKIAANNLKIQQGVKYCLTIQINLVDDMIFLIRSLFDIWSRGFRFIRKQLIEKIKIHTKFDLFKRKQNREKKKKKRFRTNAGTPFKYHKSNFCGQIITLLKFPAVLWPPFNLVYSEYARK